MPRKNAIRITPANKYLAITQKIRTQFPKDPYSQLYFAVVEQAIIDLTPRNPATRQAIAIYNKARDSAKSYLSGTIYHAEACGVDSKWIHRIMKEANITA